MNFKLDSLYRIPWSTYDNPNGWIEPTTFCQLACPGCYRGLALPNPPRIHEDLKKMKKEIDTFIKIRKIKILSIAGGEPLLYPYLDQLIKYAISKKLKVRLVTNGAALTENRLQKLKKAGVSEICIHVAAYQGRTSFKTEKQTNIIRERLCQIFRRVKGVELNFIMYVSKDNFAELPFLLNFYKQNADVVNRVMFTTLRDVFFENGKKENSKNYIQFQALASLISKTYKTKPCAYLPKKFSKEPSWLFFAPVLQDSKPIGFADAKTAENFNKIETDNWSSFPAKTGLLELFKSLKSISFPTYRNVLKGYFSEVLKNPKNLLKIPKVQLVLILNGPFLTEAGWTVCDGCPDAILHKGKLVPSCLLERIKNGENITL